MNLVKEFSSYIFFGILTNLIGIVFYIFLVRLNIYPLISLSICYSITIINNFRLNKKYTFHKKSSNLIDFFKFTLGYFWIYILNVITLLVFSDFLKVNNIVIQITFTFIAGILLFLYQKFFVLKK